MFVHGRRKEGGQNEVRVRSIKGFSYPLKYRKSLKTTKQCTLAYVKNIRPVERLVYLTNLK